MDINTEQEVIVKIAEHSEQIKVANHRISDLEEATKRIESLTLSVEKLAIAVEQMAKEQVDYRSKQNDLAKRILEVEQMPFKSKATSWDKYVGQIISLIVGALVSYGLYNIIGL